MAGSAPAPAPPASARTGTAATLAQTPRHLAERILTSRGSLEGERKLVTVLFADLKGSMELLADRDPEDARRLLDPVLERMTEAVHRYEGTVNQVMGDGIMALFGAPLAHEDHAVRACYAALRMQEAVRRYAADLRRREGVPVAIRVGCNSGEVVVRSIGSDLHLDYTAVGQTTHLAARVEQSAEPGTSLVTAGTMRLAEGFVVARPVGPIRVKGLEAPVEVWQLEAAAPARTRLQAMASRGLARFVGRRAELEVARRAVEEAAAGQGQVVAVVGEAGVGKSRLVHELLRARCAESWTVLSTVSASYGQATLALPLRELLRGYFGVGEDDGPRMVQERVMGKLLTLDETLREAIPAALGLFGALAEDSPFHSLDPGERRRRTLDLVTRVVLREAAARPVALVFEDLHWIDVETHAFLDGIVERLPGARLLLLVNYRPEYRHEWSGKSYYTQIRVGPLDAASARLLLDTLLGAEAGLDPIKRLVIERAGGNPFFLEESVRGLVEAGAVVGTPGAYRPGPAGRGADVPATVHAMVAARIDRLDPADKAVLQTAAVIGRTVPLGLLAAVAQTERHALLGPLGRLRAAEFLVETPVLGDPEYVFSHALVQEVAYAELLLERRRGLHGRVLDALEGAASDSPADVEVLAHHAQRSERWAQAARHLFAAGRRAFARGASAAVAPFFEGAIQAVDRAGDVGDQQVKLDALHELLANCVETGAVEGIRPLIEEAEALAARLGHRSGLARVRLQQAQLAWSDLNPARAGNLPEAITLAREAAELAEPADLRTTSYARFLLGAAWWDTGDLEAAAEAFEAGTRILAEAVIRPEEEGLLRPIAASLWTWRAPTEAALGRFGPGEAAAARGLEIARRMGHPATTTMAQAFGGLVRLMRGDPLAALPLLETGLALAQEHSIGYAVATHSLYLGWVLLGGGDRKRGLALVESALEMGGAWPSGLAKFSRYGAITAAAFLAGDRLADARREIVGGRRLAAAQGARGCEPALLRLDAEISALEGPRDLAPALALAAEALALARSLGMRPETAVCHLTLARLHQAAGAPDRARPELAAAAALAREIDMRLPGSSVPPGRLPA
jgi:class 3 adenylate cyclase/tetratricopeptide (TPR) repeat protein